jgi:hypothetical protein
VSEVNVPFGGDVLHRFARVDVSMAMVTPPPASASLGILSFLALGLTGMLRRFKRRNWGEGGDRRAFAPGY